jgi:hypothetical protein
MGEHMNFDELRAPFPIEKISWRVGATNGDKTQGIALAYIDARDVMERLDDVCGIGNWQSEYPYKGCCRIGIKIDGEWVWKTNGAGETQVEADKGQYSDAFKRAGVLWGIGRYLYDTPNTWVELTPAGRSYKIKNPKDPKLEGALKKAQAIYYSQPIQKPIFETNKARTDWMVQAKAEIEACESKDEVNKWIQENIKKLSSLGPKQHETMNNLCVAQMGQFDQENFENKMAAE